MGEDTRRLIDKFLYSRKAWATVLGVVVVVVLALVGADTDTVTQAAAIIVAVYTGSVALEDGLRALAELWRGKVD